MQYTQVVHGTFFKKVNRFVAEVEIDDQLEVVHIKNTGRLKEILVPGAMIALERSNNPRRKTAFSIIAAKKGVRWINIDSQIPNDVIFDALQGGEISEFKGLTSVKREASYEGSRFDFLYYRGETPGFIEVKGVTLEQDGLAMFPDAPTTRGRKHVETLVEAVHAGYEATVLFVIQMKGCYAFRPYIEMDPLFSTALVEAAQQGVRLLAYDCQVTDQFIAIDAPVPINLNMLSGEK